VKNGKKKSSPSQAAHGGANHRFCGPQPGTIRSCGIIDIVSPGVPARYQIILLLIPTFTYIVYSRWMLCQFACWQYGYKEPQNYDPSTKLAGLHSYTHLTL